MLKIAIAALACSAAAWGAEPVVDNDRVIVWDTTQVLPPAQHDFVATAPARQKTVRKRQGRGLGLYLATA
jgi:hypothetical protein